MLSQKPLTWLLVLTTLTLSACSNRLNTKNVEATIKADIERQGRRLSLKEVRCPSDVERQAGAYFRCVGELEPEGTFTINVTQENAQGNITWDVPNSRVILNLVSVEERIQQGLAQALGQQAPIDCGSEMYRINQPGDRFECEIVGGLTVGPSSVESVLVKIDPQGNLNWQERYASTQATVPASASPSQTATVSTADQAASVSVTTPTTSSGAAKTTTVQGPTGREVERPYVPGDDD